MKGTLKRMLRHGSKIVVMYEKTQMYTLRTLLSASYTSSKDGM